MAGILNNKSRVMDTVITQEGLRQLAAGDFRIVYASFSDGEAFYESDAVSGSTDAGDRIYFEATSRPHDAIAFEADDAGRLQARRGLFRDGVGVQNGKVIQSSDAGLTILTGSTFASEGTRLFKSSIDNFKRHRIIGSAGPFEEDSEFSLSVNTGSFNITDRVPFDTRSDLTVANLDSAGDLFEDPRLSHIPNFQYLPPINEPAFDGQAPRALGSYQPLGPRDELEPTEVMEEIQRAESQGNALEVEFAETSLPNNLFAQFFEVRQSDLIKLDVIDYGTFVTGDSPVSKHVFFVGKVFTNSYGINTYIHLFTLMFYDKVRTTSAF